MSSTLLALGLVNLPSGGTAAAAVANNGLLAVSTGTAGFGRDYDIHLANPDGSALQPLPAGEENEFAPDWSPSGAALAFQSGSFGGSSYRISVANVDGTGLRQLTEYGAGIPKWSPDGTKIAYQVREEATSPYGQLWVMNADGTDKRALPYPFTRVGDYDWHPDGSLAFVAFNLRGSDFGNSIYRAPLTGTPPGAVTTLLLDGDRMRAHGQALTALPGLEFSPDGSRLLFTQQVGVVAVCPDADNVAVTELFTVSGDGATLTRVTRTSGGLEAQESDATWAPDGSRLAYTALSGFCREGRSLRLRSSIRTAQIDGTDVRVVLTQPDSDTAGGFSGVAWQPCTPAAARCTVAAPPSPSPSASPSAGPPAGPSASPSPGVPGPSASPRPSPSSSPAPSAPASASASPTPSATAPVPPRPTPGPEDAPGVTVLQPVISAGQRVTVDYSGTPGSTLDILSRTQPATEFTRIGSVVLDSSGFGTSSHAPQKNTRITARTLAGVGSLQQPIIAVRSVASLTVARVGTRTYSFRGRVYPARTQRLVSLYRNGVLFAQGRTGADGIYTIVKTSTAGTYDFQVRTSDDTYNLGTRSPARRISVS